MISSDISTSTDETECLKGKRSRSSGHDVDGNAGERNRGALEIGLDPDRLMIGTDGVTIDAT